MKRYPLKKNKKLRKRNNKLITNLKKKIGITKNFLLNKTLKNKTKKDTGKKNITTKHQRKRKNTRKNTFLRRTVSSGVLSQKRNQKEIK